jgi:hypothetical protein
MIVANLYDNLADGLHFALFTAMPYFRIAVKKLMAYWG